MSRSGNTVSQCHKCQQRERVHSSTRWRSSVYLLRLLLPWLNVISRPENNNISHFKSPIRAEETSVGFITLTNQQQLY